MTELTEAQRDKLVTDLKLVIADAEELLRQSAGEVGSSAVALRERVEERIRQAREGIARLQDAAIEKARAAGHAADDWVHEKPWYAIGAAAGVGLLVGLLIGRR
jgi:ElaB/YqjD/DUF883 family membrane-anchored ribosome-binding protein